MRPGVRGFLIVLMAVGLLQAGLRVTAGAEPTEGVVSGTVPFEAGETVPGITHRVIKIRSLEIEIGEVSGWKARRKIDMRMRVDNFGEKDYEVIVDTSLLDADGKIVSARTVKGDIDKNDSRIFGLKFMVAERDVTRIKDVRLELSFLRD